MGRKDNDEEQANAVVIETIDKPPSWTWRRCGPSFVSVPRSAGWYSFSHSTKYDDDDDCGLIGGRFADLGHTSILLFSSSSSSSPFWDKPFYFLSSSSSSSSSNHSTAHAPWRSGC
jgi:hypothetical protein